ncbi:MAG: hypothetical protein RQ754_16255 [Desulfuromonadales bacterium]|nr:hypothetical protein [Desulfuromonadales bacterium]
MSQDFAQHLFQGHFLAGVREFSGLDEQLVALCFRHQRGQHCGVGADGQLDDGRREAAVRDMAGFADKLADALQNQRVGATVPTPVSADLPEVVT